jgi:hypothetical protein
MAVAWVLNLDADEELAAPRGYTPSARALARAREAAARTGLVGPEDVVVWEGDVLEEARVGIAGRAFSMTPRARRILERAGAVPEPAPSLDVLRRVSSRRFSAELGQTLEGARFASTLAEVDETIASFGERRLVMKRAHSHAGRGQRRLVRSETTAAERAWIEASLPLGGLQIEPEVAIEIEFATHGYAHEDGRIEVAAPKILVCDRRGAWIETRPSAPGEIGEGDAAALVAEAERVGRALHAARYFGPFGVDAHRWRDARGSHVRLRSEVNARYTMAWSIERPVR